jgi:hypothetical protein
VAVEVLDIYRAALGDASEGAFDPGEGSNDGGALPSTAERRPRRRRRRRR